MTRHRKSKLEPRMAKCSRCNGTGSVRHPVARREFVKCGACDGTGARISLRPPSTQLLLGGLK